MWRDKPYFWGFSLPSFWCRWQCNKKGNPSGCLFCYKSSDSLSQYHLLNANVPIADQSDEINTFLETA